jgi:hypothetical protein
MVALFEERKNFFGLLATHAVRLIDDFPYTCNVTVFDLGLDG